MADSKIRIARGQGTNIDSLVFPDGTPIEVEGNTNDTKGRSWLKIGDGSATVEQLYAVVTDTLLYNDSTSYSASVDESGFYIKQSVDSVDDLVEINNLKATVDLPIFVGAITSSGAISAKGDISTTNGGLSVTGDISTSDGKVSTKQLIIK